MTEACFQQTPLDFVGNTTVIRYADNSRAPFAISAVTTSVGTYPAGSMWRKNPIPMCNCDLGYMCEAGEAGEAQQRARAGRLHGPIDAKTMFIPYNKTNFRPGQTSKACPTGLQYPSQWDGGEGGPPYMPGQDPATMDGLWNNYEMVDTVRVYAHENER